MLRALAIAPILLLASPAAAASLCGKHSIVDKVMREEGKRLVAAAILDPGGVGMYELYADAEGNWAGVVTLAENPDRSCIIQTGTGWQQPPEGSQS